MESPTSRTSGNPRQTGIKRRRREDLVIRVFKPGMQLQQILNKAERRKKDDKTLNDKNGDEFDDSIGGRFSQLSNSPRSLVNTPIEMYRKFWHGGGSETSQLTTANAREAEGKSNGGSKYSPTTTTRSPRSPRSFRPRWRMSRTFAGDTLPAVKGTDVERQKRNSSEKKEKMSGHDKQQQMNNDDHIRYNIDSKATKTLKRSDSVITVVPALASNLNEATATSPLSESYPQRPIYIHGPIRLQEGALAPFSARKDSIASLEAFLTTVTTDTAAIEPMNSVQEARRASDDAAEKDIVDFFDSYGFAMGARMEDGYRLDRFSEDREGEEEDDDYQSHNEDESCSEEAEEEDDEDDGDTICFRNNNIDSDTNSDTEHISPISPISNDNNIKFIIAENHDSPSSEEHEDHEENEEDDDTKDGYCDNDDDNNTGESFNMGLFYALDAGFESESQSESALESKSKSGFESKFQPESESESESESDVIEIALAE